MKVTDRKLLQAVVGGTLSDEQRRAISDILSGSSSAVAKNGGALLLSQAQVARQLSCSRFTIYRLEKLGQLRPVFLTATLKRFRRADVEALANGGLSYE